MDRKPVEEGFESFISDEFLVEDTEVTSTEEYHHEKPDKPVGDKRRKLEDILAERKLKKELEQIDNWGEE